MTDQQITELTLDSSVALTDLAVTVEDPGGTPVTKKTLWSTIRTSFLATHSGELHYKDKLVSNPQAVYAQRAQIPLFRAPQALTITRIHITTNQTAQQLAGDLKWADDVLDGSFANATVIDVCDTTSGVFTATSSFDDATIASGKYVYFQMDASPNAAIKDFFIEIYFTFD